MSITSIVGVLAGVVALGVAAAAMVFASESAVTEIQLGDGFDNDSITTTGTIKLPVVVTPGTYQAESLTVDKHGRTIAVTTSQRTVIRSGSTAEGTEHAGSAHAYNDGSSNLYSSIYMEADTGDWNVKSGLTADPQKSVDGGSYATFRVGTSRCDNLEMVDPNGGEFKISPHVNTVNHTAFWPNNNASGVLANDGSGNLVWQAGAAASGSAGPANAVQYNSGGSMFGGNSAFTYDGTKISSSADLVIDPTGDINMSDNTISGVTSIESTANLTINPTGNVMMSNKEIRDVTAIKSSGELQIDSSTRHILSKNYRMIYQSESLDADSDNHDFALIFKTGTSSWEGLVRDATDNSWNLAVGGSDPTSEGDAIPFSTSTVFRTGTITATELSTTSGDLTINPVGNIDTSGRGIINLSSVTSQANLLLNPTGNIDAGDNMIDNVSEIRASSDLKLAPSGDVDVSNNVLKNASSITSSGALSVNPGTSTINFNDSDFSGVKSIAYTHATDPIDVNSSNGVRFNITPLTDISRLNVTSLTGVTNGVEISGTRHDASNASGYLYFRESNGADTYGFKLNYNGQTGNLYTLTSHNNSTVGNIVYSVVRESGILRIHNKSLLTNDTAAFTTGIHTDHTWHSSTTSSFDTFLRESTADANTGLHFRYNGSGGTANSVPSQHYGVVAHDDDGTGNLVYTFGRADAKFIAFRNLLTTSDATDFVSGIDMDTEYVDTENSKMRMFFREHANVDREKYGISFNYNGTQSDGQTRLNGPSVVSEDFTITTHHDSESGHTIMSINTRGHVDPTDFSSGLDVSEVPEVRFHTVVRPEDDREHDLGATGTRWATVYGERVSVRQEDDDSTTEQPFLLDLTRYATEASGTSYKGAGIRLNGLSGTELAPDPIPDGDAYCGVYARAAVGTAGSAAISSGICGAIQFIGGGVNTSYAGFGTDLDFSLTNSGTAGYTKLLRLSSPGHLFPLKAGHDLGENTLARSWNNIYMSGSITNTSDENEKREKYPLEHGLDLVRRLKPTRYKWRDRTKGDDELWGFLAQDVYEVVGDGKNIHTIGEKGVQGIVYTEFIAVLTKAIQDLDATVKSQADEIAALKSLIA